MDGFGKGGGKGGKQGIARREVGVISFFIYTQAKRKQRGPCLVPELERPNGNRRDDVKGLMRGECLRGTVLCNEYQSVHTGTVLRNEYQSVHTGTVLRNEYQSVHTSTEESVHTSTEETTTSPTTSPTKKSLQTNNK